MDVRKNLIVAVYQRMGANALLRAVNAAKTANVETTVNAELTAHANRLKKSW